MLIFLATGRQASAKTFIKTNCDRAELSLTLSNVGEEAFKPQEYGSSITIERKISKDGVSSYRLLNDKS
jgi:chromosome segregation ATPase